MTDFGATHPSEQYDAVPRRPKKRDPQQRGDQEREQDAARMRFGLPEGEPLSPQGPPPDATGTPSRNGFVSQAAEYLGFCLMVLGFGWLLLYSNSLSIPRKLPRSWVEARRGSPAWMEQHLQYRRRMAAARDEGQELDLVVYGDNLVEMWEGTTNNRPDHRAFGIPAVFAAEFGSYNTALFGISGDTTGMLLWRLQHGELPKGITVKVVVLLIGSNDLQDESLGDDRASHSANATSEHIIAILQAVHEAVPDALLVSIALLPRGEPERHPDPEMYSQPSKFTHSISWINEAVARSVKEWGSSVSQLDCGHFFLTPGGSALEPELMPDAVHPSIKGMRLLTQCIHGAVRQALTG